MTRRVRDIAEICEDLRNLIPDFREVVFRGTSPEISTRHGEIPKDEAVWNLMSELERWMENHITVYGAYGEEQG